MMNKNAKRLMAALIIIGLGLTIYGTQTDAVGAIFFGIAIAIIGGLVGKMQREDDKAGH